MMEGVQCRTAKLLKGLLVVVFISLGELNLLQTMPVLLRFHLTVILSYFRLAPFSKLT